jgi:hypothetical protein
VTGAAHPVALKLATLEFELFGVNLEELSLLACEFLPVRDLALDGAYLLRLLAEGEVREDPCGDRADGENEGSDRSEDGRTEEGHGRRLAILLR